MQNRPHPGQLRHLLTFRNPPTADEYGTRSELDADYNTAFVCRGSVSPIDGSEKVNAGQVQAETTHLITIRGKHEPRPKQRIASTIRGTARKFEIVHVRDIDERGEYKQIEAKELDR